MLNREHRQAKSPKAVERGKLLVDAPSKGRDGAVSKCGERVGSRWKDTLEHNQERPTIIVDLPSADHKLAN
jgi:hypothetical protein